eukprot:s3363_g3.t2
MCRGQTTTLSSGTGCSHLEEVQIRAESLATGLRSRVSLNLNLVEDQDAAEHMARYLTWAAQAPKVPKAQRNAKTPSPESPERSRLRTGAASGVAVAAEVLGQAMVAMSRMQDRFDRLNVAFQDLERNGGMASAFNGERPVAVDSAARASEATVQAAECCFAALKALPVSTVWVELPDPISTADALEAAAAILKSGRLQLAELEAFQVVTLNRIEAQAKSASYRSGPADFPVTGSPFTMAITEFPCGPKLCSASGTYLWSEARGLLKAFAAAHQIDREFGASILSEVFHVFDDLIDGLARILEELICLESETDSMCPALLGAAQVQKDLLEWKLTLLDDEISQTQQCKLMEFVEVVLAVGDALQAAIAQLRRRRQQVVEGMKASIEIKAAMMPATEGEAPQLKNFVETTVVRELKKQLSKIISEAKDVKVKVAKRSKAAATGTGDTGGDAPEAAEAEDKLIPGAHKEEEAEESDKKAKKKRRRILGAEDKAEEEERVADAMDAEADGGDEEEESLSSGFYTSVDGDDEKAIEDPDEQELEGAEGTKGNEEEDEEGANEEKPEKDEDEEQECEEDAPAEGGDDMTSPKGKRAKKGDTGGTKEEREEDEKDGGSGGMQKAKTGTQEGSKNRKTKPGSSARQLGDKAASLQKQAEKDLAEALKEDNLVWRSELRGDSMSIIVNHNHSQCPHSLFVGEVLRGVLSTATLQDIRDPACDGVEAVHVKVENDKVSLECEAINLFGLLCLPPTLVAHSQIYTNNLRTAQGPGARSDASHRLQHVLETFGVEAARASVVREVRGVFGHYGIQVDHRHLSLIADYMAQAGGLRPFNRMGMVHCTSPLLQMSYETTMQFLSGACKEDLLDNMISPASAIVLGQPPAVGTGVVNLLVDLDPPDPPWKKQRRFKMQCKYKHSQRNVMEPDHGPVEPEQVWSFETLCTSDWRRFRTAYLGAMRDSPDAFTASLETEEAHLVEKWQERIQQSVVVFCASAGCDVGFAWVLRRGDAVTLGLWVAPEHRCRGIGAALLDAAIQWARSVGARRVSLNVADGAQTLARLGTRCVSLRVPLG